MIYPLDMRLRSLVYRDDDCGPAHWLKYHYNRGIRELYRILVKHGSPALLFVGTYHSKLVSFSGARAGDLLSKENEGRLHAYVDERAIRLHGMWAAHRYLIHRWLTSGLLADAFGKLEDLLFKTDRPPRSANELVNKLLSALRAVWQIRPPTLTAADLKKRKHAVIKDKPQEEKQPPKPAFVPQRCELIRVAFMPTRAHRPRPAGEVATVLAMEAAIAHLDAAMRRPGLPPSELRDVSAKMANLKKQILSVKFVTPGMPSLEEYRSVLDKKLHSWGKHGKLGSRPTVSSPPRPGPTSPTWKRPGPGAKSP
ncbi:hypothetical protein DFJ74DRAFT_62358 [Hyaloraphidium curvatum]|nr:hypothetical protein DFJ74DRAFT_62358 [Hyaloraphidium curvatum]